jgi:hypothetical protein
MSLMNVEKHPLSFPTRFSLGKYTNEFPRDVIQECGEASLEFPRKVFLGEIYIYITALRLPFTVKPLLYSGAKLGFVYKISN